MSSNVMAAECLLQLGADPNALDKEGKTPLMMAAIKTNPKFGKALLGKTAKLTVPSLTTLRSLQESTLKKSLKGPSKTLRSLKISLKYSLKIRNFDNWQES